MHNTLLRFGDWDVVDAYELPIETDLSQQVGDLVRMKGGTVKQGVYRIVEVTWCLDDDGQSKLLRCLRLEPAESAAS